MFDLWVINLYSVVCTVAPVDCLVYIFINLSANFYWMNKLETFEQYLATSGAGISVSEVVIALLLAALMSWVVSKVYVKYGTALSNREKFASNFLVLSMTTTLVITVVKSSLALSLGLVGALSIVRFRAAIKEPEELGFLFLVISIGLGFGANQILITVVAISLICFLFVLRSKFGKSGETPNMSLTITSSQPDKVTLDKVVRILEKHCILVHLKRFDAADKLVEASFFVTFDSFRNLSAVKKELEQLARSVKIIYLDRE